MKNYSSAFLLAIAGVLLLSSHVLAQSDSTGAEKSDKQNQMRFMKPDFESDYYNFYSRKEISSPLQPRYDLDSAVYQKGKKRQKQQQAFLNNQYYYPAKPKDQWEIGINFGSAMVSGDVKPLINPIQNFGVGFHVRKSLGYIFSLRLGYNFEFMTGRNWEFDANLKNNKALNGSGSYNSKTVNYYNNPLLRPDSTEAGLGMNNKFIHNFRTYVHEINLSAIANLGNIKFHRERNLVNIYAFGGAGAMLFLTKTNALNENGEVYDLSKLYDETVKRNQVSSGAQPDSRTTAQRKYVLKELRGILDNSYESYADREVNLVGVNNFALLPTFHVGAGVAFHATKFMTIGIEQRVTFTMNDAIDGNRWQQDDYAGLTRDNDNISYTSVSLNFHLGSKKRVEPLYWLNPMGHTYKKLGEMDPDKIINELTQDDDGDGVPNKLDREPNSKKGCPVDTHGVMLDSDKDGIADCEDKEPFSAPGYPVDKNGVAIIPPNPCCDENRKGAGKGGYDCSKIELPSIHFDQDRFGVDPSYYGSIHAIAERMQMCPDVKIVVTGFDQSRNDQKYNEQLSWNRANEVVNYLVEKYGISRDRFIVDFKGGKAASGGTEKEKKAARKVEFRYAGDGEKGESNPPAPHPGLKAGSNK